MLAQTSLDSISFGAKFVLWRKGQNSKEALNEIYRILLIQALSEKETRVKIEFLKITNLAIGIYLRHQNSIFSNKFCSQKLKFEN